MSAAGKWVSRVRETLIYIASLPVFFLLDILDVIMCLFFRLVDQFLEGKPSSCYCMPRDTTQQQDPFAADNGERQLSESLHQRKNIFREMGLLKLPTKNGPFPVEKRNRWSDCGCQSCLSWMNNEKIDPTLYLVVNEPEREDEKESNEGESNVENVIFLHGFLSSSSLWKETVFLNLSEHSRQNCRLFAVDLLGFGQSPKPEDCLYTLRDHVDMIKKSVIGPFGLNSFHLVAHSMGCVIALALAAEYSASVKSITLIAPPYFSASRGDATAEALRRLAVRRVWPPLLFFSAFMSWYEHLGRCMCFLLCRNHRVWEWILKLVTRRRYTTLFLVYQPRQYHCMKIRRSNKFKIVQSVKGCRGLISLFLTGFCFLRSRDLHFLMTDVTRHTHHSAWHTMHNVICGGARFLDEYLEVLRAAGAKICVVQGRKDDVVPVECSLNLKMKDPEIELEIIPNADHSSVIMGRTEEFTRNLERIWAST